MLASAYAQASYPRQLWALTKRSWLDNLRNPGIFWYGYCFIVTFLAICLHCTAGLYRVRLIMYVMLAFMIATLFADMGYGQKRVADRISMLFFINAFLVFMSIAVIPSCT